MRRSILVTRPAHVADDTARRLHARGWRTILAPVAAVEPVAADFPPPGTIQAILLTSANALAALPPGYRTVRILAVGDATAREAAALGFRQVASAGGDAADLAALAVRTCAPAGGALLHPCAENAPLALAAELAAAGFQVLRCVCYRTRTAAALSPEAARALAAGELFAAAFFSPATAHAFVGLVLAAGAGGIEDVTALALSPAVADALTPLPWRRIRVASLPNQDELLALLP